MAEGVTISIPPAGRRGSIEVGVAFFVVFELPVCLAVLAPVLAAALRPDVSVAESLAVPDVSGDSVIVADGLSEGVDESVFCVFEGDGLDDAGSESVRFLISWANSI